MFLSSTMSRQKSSSVESSVASLNISVNIEDIRNHLDFLKSIEGHDDKFYDDNYVQNSLRRYEKFWLPLILNLADNPNDQLKFAPPIGKQYVKES